MGIRRKFMRNSVRVFLVRLPVFCPARGSLGRGRRLTNGLTADLYPDCTTLLASDNDAKLNSRSHPY